MPKLIDNRHLILNTYNNRHEYKLTIKQIAKIFNIDPKTVCNYRHQSLSFINSSTIFRNSFLDHQIDDVIQFIINNTINNLYFSIRLLKSDINKLFKISLSAKQIYFILKSNNITYKKATILQKSKKPEAEINNMINERINTVNELDDVVFTDEVHIVLADTNKYGWNVSGKKTVFDKKAPNKVINKRFTIIASVSKSKKISYKICEKNVNGEVFKKYINNLHKKILCKNHFIDNARIHHYRKFKEMCKKYKINTIYGVPYTPFLNIIENFFRSFKSKLRKELLDTRINIKKTIRKCWNSVSEDVLLNTYNHVYNKRQV